MNKEELLKAIMELPKIETNNPISTMNGINVDDLMSAVDRLNKVPDYNDLLKENQELKQKLDKYENPEDMTLMMMWSTEKVKDENKKLKKQLENKYEKVGTLTSELLYEENTKLINRQKEFIKYLEDEIKSYKNRDTYIVVDILGSYDLNDINLKLLEEILQKYKSIIGVSDDKK